MLLYKKNCSLLIEHFKTNYLVKPYNLLKYSFFTDFYRLSQSALKKSFGKVFLTNLSVLGTTCLGFAFLLNLS